MAVNTLQFRQPGQADTNRSPSGSIWADCPWESIIDGSINGAWVWDDFTKFPKTPATTEGNFGDYAQFSSTGGTIAGDTTELGGAIAIGSDDDNEGCSIRTRAVPFKLNRANRSFWFEARVLSSTITDAKHNFIVGLFEDVALDATHPLTATGTLSDNRLCVFHRPETAKTVAGTGGATVNVEYKASGVTAVTLAKDVATLVANTYVKLGIKFYGLGPNVVDPFSQGAGDGYGKFLLSFYVNGVRAAEYQMASGSGTDFPNDADLGLVFATMNATGTTPGTSSIDWWRAAQLI